MEWNGSLGGRESQDLLFSYEYKYNPVKLQPPPFLSISNTQFVPLQGSKLKTSIPSPQTIYRSSRLPLTSSSTVSQQGYIIQGELKRGNYNHIVKLASTGETIGTVVSAVAVVIFLGLFCRVMTRW